MVAMVAHTFSVMRQMGMGAVSDLSFLPVPLLLSSSCITSIIFFYFFLRALALCPSSFS